MKPLSAFGNKVFLFCGVKNILKLSRPLVLEKRQANAPVFLLGMVLRRLSNTLLSVCWCPENGTSLHTRGFGKILHNSLSPGFYFLSGLSFLPSFFSQLFPSSPYPVSFVSFFFYPFPHSLSLSRCKFYSPSLSSFLPLPPSFLPPCNVSPFFLAPSLLASTFACFIPHALSSCILNLCSFAVFFNILLLVFYHVIIVRMMMMMIMIIIIIITLNYYLSLFLFQYSSSFLPIVSNRTVLRTHSWLNSGRSKQIQRKSEWSTVVL